MGERSDCTVVVEWHQTTNHSTEHYSCSLDYTSSSSIHFQTQWNPNPYTSRMLPPGPISPPHRTHRQPVIRLVLRVNQPEHDRSYGSDYCAEKLEPQENTARGGRHHCCRRVSQTVRHEWPEAHAQRKGRAYALLRLVARLASIEHKAGSRLAPRPASCSPARRLAREQASAHPPRGEP